MDATATMTGKRDAVWRGNLVAVLHEDTKRAVIITPCQVKLAVHIRELREPPKTARHKRDSRKF